MMAGKVVGLGFEIISKLDSYFLMTVKSLHSVVFTFVDVTIPTYGNLLDDV